MDVSQEKDFMIIQKSNIVTLISFLLLFFSCKNDNNRGTIPYAYVDIQINLSNAEYQPLQTQGGYINIDGGVRGIIVYRNYSNDYLAFERNCPNAPSEDCAKVSVDSSSLYIQCPCCTSQFDFDGAVISGPSPYPLKRYSTSVNSNFLTIRN